MSEEESEIKDASQEDVVWIPTDYWLRRHKGSIMMDTRDEQYYAGQTLYDELVKEETEGINLSKIEDGDSVKSDLFANISKSGKGIVFPYGEVNLVAPADRVRSLLEEEVDGVRLRIPVNRSPQNDQNE